ncbi:pyridoxamine 5'-phosphate oxidase family protein [Salinisphaera sp. T31B1]|uniref:pyridoxamine 5'-phosphate oxidase family protein n=1 Tax=Salinisphaera sp. T31B1 TaxID=727963 RepID=UPI003340F09F
MDEHALGARCAELMSTCLYANIATSADDQPWNTPVTAVADDALAIYWSSWVDAVHSKNIDANPRVFLTYYDSTRPRGTNNHRCLYLRCEAAVVTDDVEARKAHRLIYPDEDIDLAGFVGDGLRRFYRARPLQAWLNCLSERQVSADTLDMREPVPLERIRAAV